MIRVAGALFALGLVFGAASPARAHGREPMLGAIAFDPTDRDHVVVRATWALLESFDGGQTWVWRCANAIGYDRTTEDPPIVVTLDHSIVAGTFDGVVRSASAACEWGAVDDTDVRGTYSIDLDLDPGNVSVVWGIQSPGAIDNTLVRSLDQGITWEVVSTPRGGKPIVLLERLALAPSDPMRVYVSGASPATSTSPTRRAFFYRSEDGGETFVEREIPLLGEERNVHVLAVDPTDADRVFVRVTRRVTDLVPERLLLSEDGGETWETATELLEITGLAISEDGAHVWVGGWDGAFQRSDARGAVGSFTPVSTDPDLRVRCLAYRPGEGGAPGELWVCADDIMEPYGLARSTDLGQTLEPLWTFTDASPETGCSACSSVALVCGEYWADVIFDLGLSADAGPVILDAGLPAECVDGGPVMDGGPGADAGRSPSAQGCGCHAVGSGRNAPLALALALLAALFRRSRTHGSV